MKKYLNILMGIILLASCNKEGAFDCIKTTGDITLYEISVPSFTELDIHNNTHVTLVQGTEQKVTLITGENLKDKIEFTVNDGVLRIEDKNTCTWARDYGKVEVRITTDNLTQIRSSGGGQIISEGVLTFPDLVLISEQHTGDFTLQVQMESLKIINNNLSNYYLSGDVDKLQVYVYSGDGRFEGNNLIANYIDIYHEGTNDIIVNPQETLTGQIQQTGNVIYCQEPPNMTIKIIDDRGSLIEGC